MTARELVIHQLAHHETAQIPYAKLDCEPSYEKALTAHYGSDAWKRRLNNAILQITGVSIENRALGHNQYADLYGSVWRRGDNGVDHMVQPAISEPSAGALKALKLPDADWMVPDEKLHEINATCHANGDLFTMVHWGYGLFERVWALCGFEDALCYLLTEPEFYADLIGRIAEHQTAIARRFALSDVDAMFLADDWGAQHAMIVSPEIWRRMIKPGYSALVDSIKQRGKYVIHHSCGHITPIVGDLAEIGVDCLQSLQPESMNPYELKRDHGDAIAFWGGLGSQSLIPFGTPDDIRREVRRLCGAMARGGGYILGPSKIMQDDTPVENAMALIDAFNAALAGEFSQV